MLPLGLLIFLLPALLLAPFYIVVYSTTVTALNNVIEAQVSCGRLAALPSSFSAPSHTHILPTPRGPSQGMFTMATQRAGISREIMMVLSGSLGQAGFSSHLSVRMLLFRLSSRTRHCAPSYHRP